MSIDMSMLHPRLQSALNTLQSQCSAKGLVLGFSDGYRSAADQDALYAQGRTQPGSIVTNARGGYSQHNWGIAADFFQNIRGKEWEVSFFNTVGPMAESLGLGWGGRWTDFTDRPHLYLPDWGDTPTPLINTYGLHGYDAFRATWGGTSAPAAPSTGSGSSSGAQCWQDTLAYPLFYSEMTKNAQIHLNNYVNAGLEIDGYIGPATLIGLFMALQYACNCDFAACLVVDGIWGPKTEAAIKGHYVSKGESQELARAVQIFLLARGYDPGPVDGDFESKSEAATIRFQTDHGLAADGVAGFDTIRKLLFVI